jgi:phage protein D
MTDQLLRATTPVFRIDGQVSPQVARDLLHLEIEEGTDGLRTLTLRLLGFGPQADAPKEKLLYLDGAIFDFGKSVDVSIGATDEARTVFTGAVSAIEAAFSEGSEPAIAIFAEDKLMSLRMTRRMRTYLDKSDADIASDIASEHGLTPDTQADGPTYDVVQQWNQSDLAFLRERARLAQADVWVEGDKLCFKSRANRSGPQVTLVRGNHLIEAQLRGDLAHQRTKIKVSGYDASSRDRIDEEAGNDAVSAEITNGRTGPQILQQAFGERTSYRVREVPLVGGEATAWAKQEMLRRARRFVTVTGTTDGTPELTVASRVTLQGVGKPFEGDPYYVTRVRHTWDLQSGHRTHFDAERATLNEES